MVGVSGSARSSKKVLRSRGTACWATPSSVTTSPRPDWVTIRYQDLDGKEHRVKKADARGYKLGRMAQHEIDHLDGVLFTERIEDLSTLHDMTQENKPRRRGLLRRRPKASGPSISTHRSTLTSHIVTSFSSAWYSAIGSS